MVDDVVVVLEDSVREPVLAQEGDAVELVQDGLVEALADAVGLRALGLGAGMVDVVDRQVEFILVALRLPSNASRRPTTRPPMAIQHRCQGQQPPALIGVLRTARQKPHVFRAVILAKLYTGTHSKHLIVVCHGESELPSRCKPSESVRKVHEG